jgi:[ribosomal protein S18]-alanine N-acetyltransferase
MDEPYRIRRAERADVPALARIERRCFSDPWSERGILESIQSETTIALVAENEEGELGYLMARLSGEEGEILNLAVLPGYRRRGLGRRLLEQGLALLVGRGVREAYLEVRESNQAARDLYLGFGFRPVGMRPHYYRNPAEDALVLRAGLTPLRD